MNVQRITEIGVAVHDLDAATALLVELLGASAGEVHEVERYAMRYRMCRVGKVDFELMEPTTEKVRKTELRAAGITADTYDRERAA